MNPVRLCLSGSMLSSGFAGCGAGGGCCIAVWELLGGGVRSASGTTAPAPFPTMDVSSVVPCALDEAGGFPCGTVVGVS